MKLILGETIPETWLHASNYLMSLKNAMDFDVILHIANPFSLSKVDEEITAEVGKFFKTYGGYPINAVAETIFPYDEYRRNGAHGVHELYPPKIKAIQAARDDGRWGNYALRILRQVDRNGTVYNPLWEMVEKIKKAGKYKACYELGLGTLPEEFGVVTDDIAIYDGKTDRRQYYGGLPCMSHLSMKVYDGHVRFNATYRSHNYIQRLFGNLVGLGRLQYFVANETGLKMGPLTINSTLARLDTGSDNSKECKWTKANIKTLLATCNKFREDEAEAA